MDSISRKLISKKFQVPSEVMEHIDGHLLDIYKEEHKQKFIIKDLKNLLEIVNINLFCEPVIKKDKYGKIYYINDYIEPLHWILKDAEIFLKCINEPDEDSWF